MTKSTSLKNSQLDAEFNSTAFSISGDPYLSLHTADPSTTGANEVAGGSYARQQAAFGSASAGSVANTAVEEFTMPACTVTHIGIWSGAGVYLRGGALTASKTFTLGEVARIAIGGVTVSEA